ncbi:hypothetical protein WAI453_012205 [Rhynchosporium graminicola]
MRAYCTTPAENHLTIRSVPVFMHNRSSLSSCNVGPRDTDSKLHASHMRVMWSERRPKYKERKKRQLNSTQFNS